MVRGLSPKLLISLFLSFLSQFSLSTSDSAPSPLDPCKRQPFRGRCPPGPNGVQMRSQFVLRYYLRNGECISYPYGHCVNDENEPRLFRYKEECEDACFGGAKRGGDEADAREAATYATIGPIPQPSSKEDSFILNGKPTGADSSTTMAAVEKKEGDGGRTECERQRQKQNEGKVFIVKGAFVPECTADGQFRPLQCESAGDECFCVDEGGIELKYSRTKGGQRPDCERISTAHRQPALVQECEGQAEQGPCSASIQRWHFEGGQCRPFNFSGCGGNGNNFVNEGACLQRCVGQSKCDGGQLALKNSQGQLVDCANANCPPGFLCQANSICCPESGLEAVPKTQQIPKKEGAIAGDLISDKKAETEICDLPKDRGPCDQYQMRFYFNRELGECKYFFYGGCEGNGNNFARVEECERACLGGKVGPREEHLKTTTTITTTITIGTSSRSTGGGERRTTEGGVDGAPKMGTSATIAPVPPREVKIAGPAETQSVEVVPPSMLPENRCQHPKDSGNCAAQFVRWFWNGDARICETFSYTGCNGNGNNFASREECLSICHREVVDTGENVDSPMKNACDSEIDPGQCGGIFMRYGFDRRSGECRQFQYGGCGGNGNNFASLADCRRKCLGEPAAPLSSNICEHGMDPGECTGTFQRFGYEQEANRCVKFVYGGCGGNGNNFATLEDCAAACVRTQCPAEPECDLDRCQLVRDAQGCPICSCPPPRHPPLVPSPPAPGHGQCPPLDVQICQEPCIIFLNRRGCRECVCPIMPSPQPNLVDPMPPAPSEPISMPKQPTPVHAPNSPSPPPRQILQTSSAPSPPSPPAPPAPKIILGGVSNNAVEVLPPPTVPPPPPPPPPSPSPSPQQTVEPIAFGHNEICSQPLDPGVPACTRFVQRWFFNSEGGNCEPFTYTGCAGNRNHFFSKKECQIYCARFSRNMAAEGVPPESSTSTPLGPIPLGPIAPQPIPPFPQMPNSLQITAPQNILPSAPIAPSKGQPDEGGRAGPMILQPIDPNVRLESRIVPELKGEGGLREELRKEAEEEEKRQIQRRIEAEEGERQRRVEMEEAERKRQKIEEENAKKRIEEENAKKRIEEENAKKRIEEENAKKRIEEENAKKRIEEENAKKRIEEEKQREKEEEIMEERKKGGGGEEGGGIEQRAEQRPILRIGAPTEQTSSPLPASTTQMPSTESKASESSQTSTTESMAPEWNSTQKEAEEGDIPVELASKGRRPLAIHSIQIGGERGEERVTTKETNELEEGKWTSIGPGEKEEGGEMTTADDRMWVEMKEKGEEMKHGEEAKEREEMGKGEGRVEEEKEEEVANLFTNHHLGAKEESGEMGAEEGRQKVDAVVEKAEVARQMNGAVLSGEEGEDKITKEDEGNGRSVDGQKSTVLEEKTTTILASTPPPAQSLLPISSTPSIAPSSSSPPILPPLHQKVSLNLPPVQQISLPFPLSPQQICSLPPDAGPCQQFVPRWFFNAQSGQCQQFSFGSCRGNPNNFADRIQCEQICGGGQKEASSSPVDSCNLEKDEGQGGGYNVHWYFNVRNLRCEQFVWQGRGGNGNRFGTEAECKTACSQNGAVVELLPRPQNVVPPPNQNSGEINNRVESAPPMVAQGASIAQTRDRQGNVGMPAPAQAIPNEMPPSPLPLPPVPPPTPSPPSSSASPAQSSSGGYSAIPLPNWPPKMPPNLPPMLGNSPPATIDYVNKKRLDGPSDSSGVVAHGLPNHVPEVKFDEVPSSPKDGGLLAFGPKHSQQAIGVPVCPNGLNAMQYSDGRPVLCLPGMGQCPEKSVCYFNGIDFFCCPNEDDPYDQHVFGGYDGEESKHGYKVGNGALRAARARRQADRMSPNSALFAGFVNSLRFDDKPPPAPQAQARFFQSPSSVSASPDSPCILPLQKGDCRQAILRYFYQSDSNQCRPFYFTGCGGNGNNFASLNECKLACKSEGPIQRGPCPGGRLPLGGPNPVLCGDHLDSIGCPSGFLCIPGPPSVCCPLENGAEIRRKPSIAEPTDQQEEVQPAQMPPQKLAGGNGGSSIAEMNAQLLLCSDGSDPMRNETDGGALVNCGAGMDIDGQEMCQPGFYCSIDPERNVRFCCPLQAQGAKLGSGSAEILAPHFGRRQPNPGEVLGKGSLPSDQQRKRKLARNGSMTGVESEFGHLVLRAARIDHGKKPTEEMNSASKMMEAKTGQLEWPTGEDPFEGSASCMQRPDEGRECGKRERNLRSNLQYFYSTAQRGCKVFFHRGCGGNGNRFETKEECEKKCGGRR